MPLAYPSRPKRRLPSRWATVGLVAAGIAVGALLSSLIGPLVQSRLVGEPSARKPPAGLKAGNKPSTRDATLAAGKSLDASTVLLGDGHLLPGWVARIYDETGLTTETGDSLDVGRFVLDEATFPMSIHQLHDIQVAGSPIYRLNAFYIANEPGPHQISLQLSYPLGATAPGQQTPAVSLAPRCRAAVVVGDKQVIDEQHSFAKDGQSEAIMAGVVELSRGLHPVEARLKCEYPTPQMGKEPQQKEVMMRIRTRRPNDVGPESRRDAFWYRVDTDHDNKG